LCSFGSAPLHILMRIWEETLCEKLMKLDSFLNVMVYLIGRWIKAFYNNNNSLINVP
jgi:hypothetical protein